MVVLSLLRYFLLHNGTEQKFVFGILLAVTLGMLALRRSIKPSSCCSAPVSPCYWPLGKGSLRAGMRWALHADLCLVIGAPSASSLGPPFRGTHSAAACLVDHVKILKVSKGDPFKLLICFSASRRVHAFLNNVTAMIIVGSLTIVVKTQAFRHAIPVGRGHLHQHRRPLTLSVHPGYRRHCSQHGYTQFLLVAGRTVSSPLW